MWCAATATVHFSAAVVFFQSPSLSFSKRAVASSTLASNCLANASPLAPMVSSLVCSSLHRRTMRLEIDRPGDTPRSPEKESRKMPVLDTARRSVVHAAEPRLGQSSGAHRLFPSTTDPIHHLVDRRAPISTLARPAHRLTRQVGTARPVRWRRRSGGLCPAATCCLRYTASPSSTRREPPSTIGPDRGRLTAAVLWAELGADYDLIFRPPTATQMSAGSTPGTSHRMTSLPSRVHPSYPGAHAIVELNSRSIHLSIRSIPAEGVNTLPLPSRPVG